MKKNAHPEYGPVVFRDKSGDLSMLTRSTLAHSSRAEVETVEIDGQTYPVIDVDVSATSHPFWTGKGRVVDSEGRVERFNRRYGSGS